MHSSLALWAPGAPLGGGAGVLAVPCELERIPDEELSFRRQG